ncbi:cell wall-active antibiotics response protein [Patescibacteria group bacterium]|nr:cell wall-active antibiotics response protein [Patescibacteria group bacterium]MBU1758694.1 cell wall-active antibiotics response protein [Patescibacteria group bacterium]
MDIQLVGGKITLYVPKEIGVQLYFKQLAGSLELTDFDVKEDKYFESKNIKTASKVVKININSGISRFKLLWE